MKNPSENAEAAEELLDRVLRKLPLRHAPAALESRVFEQLQRRSVASWWRRGFRHWPLPARVAFVAVCGALIGLTLPDAWWTADGVQAMNEAGTWSVSWAHPAIASITLAGELAALALHIVPVSWLYGLLATGALLYAALFGLGAAAYRTLYLQPSTVGDPR